MSQKCLLCGNEKFNSVITVDDAPSSVGKLLDGKELEDDGTTPISLVKCTRCKLCQLEKSGFVKEDYYDDYQMGTSYSSQMQDYQKWLSQDFVTCFDLGGKHVFEIGCGDGMFALFLNEQGSKTIGVEPSTPFYALAKKSIEVLNERLDENTSLEEKYYDAFVARQVFEHLGNPNQVLENAKLFLKPDGVGLIEVPFFSTAIEDNRYYDIFRDHVAYYTKYSLQYLLTVNNFQVIKMFASANNEYLTAYFKNNDYHETELESFSRNFATYKKNIRELFSFYKNQKVAVWGAGGKGIALLSMCQIKPTDISFVIDSDPNKWGKHTPGSHIFIKSPSKVDFNDIDMVIISAVMYQEEIVSDLRSKYNYKNKIGFVSPEPHII